MPRPAPADPRTRVNITIPASLNAEVKALAEVNLRPFSSQVELLIRKGLEGAN